MFDVSKVRYVSLIRLEGGESLLNIPYAELTVDPDLISGFVTAVIIFAKTPIRTIRKAAYDILIEVGEHVLVLLVVDPVPDEAPYREHLAMILDDVKDKYTELLENFEGDVRRFREFSLDIVKHFPFSKVDPTLVPVRIKGGRPVPYRVGSVDSKMEEIEAFVNGKRTVGEILDLIDIPEDEVMAALSILERYKWMVFERRLTDSDVLVRTDCEEYLIERLIAQYGKPMQALIDRFDGERKIGDVADSLPYDRNALWFIIRKLVEVGCLKNLDAS